MSGAGEAGGTRPRRVPLAVAVALAAVLLALLAWLGWRSWSRQSLAPWSSLPAGAAIAAGERPFDRAEHAAYRVVWRVGSTDGVTAGRAAFDASGGTDSRHFALDVASTSWAAALYDVRGRIESWTGNDLLPFRQEYHVRGGRHSTDRTTRFDWSSRTFTVSDGDRLPLASGARDGLTSWFHARTLPLAAGYRTSLLVIEAGRTYDVDVRVEGIERIPVGGRESEAFRLALVVARASDRGEIARAVAWVSADARRLPLAVDLETALGSFRLDLDAYSRQ